jgi:hypothetical protein
MPKFLEEKLEKEYPDNPKAVYGTMNKVGLMKGNKETKKGEDEEKEHESVELKEKKKRMAKKMEKKPRWAGVVEEPMTHGFNPKRQKD